MKNNTWVVLQREYMTRVKKKSFFLMTILLPILLVALMFAPALLMNMGGSAKTYAVVDETGLYADAFSDEKDVFEPVADTALGRAGLREGKYDALLWISAAAAEGNRQTIILYYEKTEPSIEKLNRISASAENKLRMELIGKESGLAPEKYDYISKVQVDVHSQDVKTGERSYTEVKTIVAYALGFLIYMFIFMFGGQIMNGVIEEKSNRIIEVMISSVKPFQLLMGKVLGLVLVSLTQFLLWALLVLVLTVVVGMVAGGGMDAAQATALAEQVTMGTQLADQVSASGMGALPINEIQSTLLEAKEIVDSLHLSTWLTFFLVYFLGGYLLYASLFAAVGSMVENQEDSNQFMLPLTVPLILGIIVIANVLKDPQGPIAFWLSIIPFTSPIVMMARIPFGVPAGELALSIGLLVLGFIGTTWMAARIYRVGILMYGKKGSYKELWKWLRYKA
ncbi:MAG: ABC transporter permease [Bacteroidales bacterium]|nr:ABC transporter permease [Bacteroidales bacterium]